MRRKKSFFKAVLLGMFATVCVAFGVQGLTSLNTSAEENTNVCNHTGYCLASDVASQINALPAPDEITLENAMEVTQQIHNIDRIKWDLDTDEELEEFYSLVTEVGENFMPTRYENAIKKLQEFKGFTQFVIQKKFDLGGEVLNYDPETEVAFAIRNVDTDKTVGLNMFYLGVSTSALGVDAYQESSDGWAFSYAMPAGTYEIVELNTDKPIQINGEKTYTQCTYMSFNGEEVQGNGMTFTIEENTDNVLIVMNSLGDSFYAVDEEGNAIENVTVTYTDDTATEQTFTSDTEGKFSYQMALIDGVSYAFSGLSNEYCAFDGCTYVQGVDGYGYTASDKAVMEMVKEGSYTYSFVFYKHSYSNYASNNDATCETDGTETAECDNGCGTKNTRTVADSALGHKYGDWVEVEAPEIMQEGERIKTCERCGNTVTESIAPKIPQKQMTVFLVVIGVIIVMAGVAFVVTKNEWTK